MRMTMSGENERTRVEMVVAYFDILSWHCAVRFEENNEILTTIGTLGEIETRHHQNTSQN
jgi:hypothetical protein